MYRSIPNSIITAVTGPRYTLTLSTQCGRDQVAETRTIPELVLYPNPVSNILEIQYQTKELCKLVIEDAYGRAIYRGELQGAKSVDVSNWAPGMYLVNVFSTDDIISKNIIVIK